MQILTLSKVLIWSIALCTVFSTYGDNKHEVNIVTEHLEPYQIVLPSGELTGYTIEIVNELLALTNTENDIQVMPWARAYNTALTEKNTLIFSMARTPFREHKFKWVGSLIIEKLYLWSLNPNLKNHVSDLDAFAPRSIATARNTNVEQYLKQINYPNIRRVVMEEQNMKMLFTRRVDSLVGSEISLKHRASTLGFDINKMHKVFEIKALEANLSIAFNKQTPDTIVNKFRSAYHQLLQSPRYQEIKDKWQISDTTDL
mgnify:CR=1 FL=1